MNIFILFGSERNQDKIYKKINILLNFTGKKLSCYQMKESAFVDNSANSPLSKEDIDLIALTNLSASEKHHLRMLAHCLQCFKSMSKKKPGSLIPVKEEWLEWCLKNPLMLQDDEFVQVMFEQFSGAAIQLERLSNDLKVAPLDLTLRNLIDVYLA
tara:strand:- start:237 stop:704 length:468 start_codon:yes stop_codon:yes gene_type:complete